MHLPFAMIVLIFCTHWVRPNPINHVCECLISTLFALVSFSWLSARFIMAFGEGVCGVCAHRCACVCARDVIHCYGSMLLSVSPCWGEECPERSVNAPCGGRMVGRQHDDTHTSITLNVCSTWNEFKQVYIMCVFILVCACVGVCVHISGLQEMSIQMIRSDYINGGKEQKQTLGWAREWV